MASYAAALVAAIRAKLKADAGVASLVKARVYDEVPRDARGNVSTDIALPYVSIGPVGGSPYREDDAKGWTVRIRLYAASTDFGRAEAWGVIAAVTSALDGLGPAGLDLGADFTLCAPLLETASGDVINPLAPKEAFADFETTIFPKG
ncbi:hypothetical protein M2322_000846 [Rhodoblastus acidophilus]|uniref:DUF3168 domain-containing protein n=1 Tax=Rhodoblastus acidophilus TaxID=1074 RepID=UPI0022257A46|nr:DUF3168 domain-containing protein [Rhodoblastus acidophilus]MCW2315312.1 hypothetical protein [Rhodoblastus acidophilus]